MGNPIFDWLIQREHVQLLLAVFALLWIVVVYLVYRRRLCLSGRLGQGEKPAPQKNFWLLIGALGPLALALWFICNAIMDALGLDSVLGLVLNLALFLIIGLCFGFLLRKTLPSKNFPNESSNNPTE
jgi:membrane protein implicated in regulation of membrane protease activity